MIPNNKAIRYSILVLGLIAAGDLPKPFNNKSILVNPDGEISREYLKHFLNPLEGLVINKGGGPIPYIDTEYARIANAELPMTKATTLYSSIGNLFVYLLMLFLLAMVGLITSKSVDI